MMKKVLAVCLLLVAACVAFLAVNSDSSRDSLPTSGALPLLFAEEGGADIVDMMVVVNAGKTSLWRQLRDSLKEPGPANAKAWKGVKARAKVVATLTDLILTKHTPEKGEKSSWDEEVSKYKSDFDKLAAAAANEDLAAATAAVDAIKGSCRSCHKPHR